MTTFFGTLTNCDLNMSNHIPYKHYKIVTIGKKNFTKQPSYARINMPIV
jgi:hypothetical protein